MQHTQFEKSLNEMKTVNQHIIIITCFVLRQVHSFFQSGGPLPKRVIHRMRCGVSFFDLHYLLVSLRLSIADYVFFLVFVSFYLFCIFNTVYSNAVPTQDMTNPISLLLFYCVRNVYFPFDSIEYFFISQSRFH